MNFIVYSKEGCPWCQKAKEFLTEKKANWMEVSIPSQEDREVFYDSAGLVGKLRTMPQIAVSYGNDNWELIGGYSDLVDNAATYFKD